MSACHRCAVAVASILLVALASAANATKPVPVFTSIDPGAQLQTLKIGGAYSPSATCLPGETRPPVGWIGYVVTPNDRYFTLLSPSSCAACAGSGALSVTVGHMGIYFPIACPTVVTVSVVGAGTLPANPGCTVPDEADILCPPLSYTLTPPAAGGYDVALPLPPGCCITRDAFLVVNFLQTGCDPAANQLGIYATAAPCHPCQSWNFYPTGGGTATDDLCGLFNQFGAGNLFMYAEADCCQPVPTRNGTWGSIKDFYR